MEKMKSSGHLKIWALSANSHEYERYARLLDQSNVDHLSASCSMECIFVISGESKAFRQ